MFRAPPGAMTPGNMNMYVLSLGTDTVIFLFRALPGAMTPGTQDMYFLFLGTNMVVMILFRALTGAVMTACWLLGIARHSSSIAPPKLCEKGSVVGTCL